MCSVLFLNFIAVFAVSEHPWFSLVPSSKFPDSTSRYATTASLKIILKLLFTEHPVFPRCIISAIDSFVKQEQYRGKAAQAGSLSLTHALHHLPFLCRTFCLQTSACSPDHTDLPHMSQTICVSTISFSARASVQLLLRLYYFPLPDAIFMSF
jgi:hypothetical protein